ncbi:OmpA family protein [Cytophagales bacterium LB-30]|uniref:OmpA family protein n=1 Tax=Shiella aurantiaca TaxID=3058365 RepID=A0ABT8F3S0_9BACT|nr:OmpA family protein [Shiella aurantiaca]MDN4165100.1 OmpA family protein [Shiella aurantiaca]
MFGSANAFAQGGDLYSLESKAAYYLENNNFKEALHLLQQLDSLSPDNPDYLFNLGKCYFIAIDKPKSLFYFLKAYSLGCTENSLLLYIAQAYQFNYDFDKSLIYLEQYRDKVMEDSFEDNQETELERVDLLVYQLKEAKALVDRKLSIGVENMGPLVNSEYPDYVPLSHNNDSILVFTSRRAVEGETKLASDGKPYENIYFSYRQADGEWSSVIPYRGFNGKYHDANVALNRDETELFIYSSKRNGDIYVSNKHQQKWGRSKPLKGINSKYWEGSIALSFHEDTLYFSSDRPGGYGGSDIYMAIKNAKGEWVNPVNLGPEINTAYDEDAPFIYKDSKTLFFSSKGHNSIGGYDVFSARINEQGKWSQLRNLGFPINTVDDDIYFQLNNVGSIGYFTSFRHSNFRERSIGEKDIFQIKRPNSSPVHFVFKGQVYDAQSHHPQPAIIKLEELNDSISSIQELAVDVNTGKFRYDLKFDTFYKLSVEVGGKMYFSQELYFPYQADLFETFMSLPLEEVPSYDVKISDILDKRAVSMADSILLDTKRNPTILLIRKVSYQDSGIKDLLASGRVPESFRKKLIQQLKDNEYLDDKEEGELVEYTIGSESPTAAPEPEMVKLDKEVKSKVVRTTFPEMELASDALHEKNMSKLSDAEKELVERITQHLLQNDSSEMATLSKSDLLFYKNLKKKEKLTFDRLLAENVRNRIQTDSILSQTDGTRKEEAVWELLAQGNLGMEVSQNKLKAFSAEAWGILYTIETSRFKFGANQKITFEALLVQRSNESKQPNTKLILTDERGNVYAQKYTDSLGYVRFEGLDAGRRYAILINDYAISLIGQSRFELIEIQIGSETDDSMSFYNTLSSEEKRSVDRVIASQLLKEMYHDNPTQMYEDEMEFQKLDEGSKKFVERFRQYLRATSADNEDFFLKRDDALMYENMDLVLREQMNRFITENQQLTQADQQFYEKLGDLEKGYIETLKKKRKSNKTIVEDFLLSSNDSDFWYVVEEFSTNGQPSKQHFTLTAKLNAKETDIVSQIRVAIMNEYNEIVQTTTLDEANRFEFYSLPRDEKYKILINKGENIANLFEYTVTDMVLSDGEIDYYESLSAEEKRFIDQYIAKELAKEQYLGNPSLMEADVLLFAQMTNEQKRFIERLRASMFANGVHADSTRLTREDNYQYYFMLTAQERQFINREMVRGAMGRVVSDDFEFVEKNSSIVFEALSENQKKQIAHLMQNRKVNSDVFAEEPFLMVDKAWVLLDSMTIASVPHQGIKIRGAIIDKSDHQLASHVPIMLTNRVNEVVFITSTDSTGFFSGDLKADASGGMYYLLAETNRNVFYSPHVNKLDQIKVDYLQIDTLQQEPSIEIYPLTLYFAFNSSELRPEERNKLTIWYNTYHENLVTYIIILHGHADSQGAEDYNFKLAQRRAEAIKQTLLGLGLANTLMVVSHGESKAKMKFPETYLDRKVIIEPLLPVNSPPFVAK